MESHQSKHHRQDALRALRHEKASMQVQHAHASLEAVSKLHPSVPSSLHNCRMFISDHFSQILPAFDVEGEHFNQVSAILTRLALVAVNPEIIGQMTSLAALEADYAHIEEILSKLVATHTSKSE